MNGAGSAQKNLQGSKTETRELPGGMEECFHDKDSFMNLGYFTKRKQEKIEQVATPVISHPSTSGTWAASDSLASLAAVDEEATLGLSNSAFSFETRSIFVKQPWHARD